MKSVLGALKSLITDFAGGSTKQALTSVIGHILVITMDSSLDKHYCRYLANNENDYEFTVEDSAEVIVNTGVTSTAVTVIPR